jgi:hypothetical protein
MADGGSMAVGELRVRGVVFYNLMNALRLRTDGATADAVLAAMPGPIADAFHEHSLVPTAYYPVEWYRAAYRAVSAVTGRGPEFAREIGKLTIEHNVPMLFRVFLSILTPDFLLPRTEAIFRRYFDRGAVRVVDRGRKWAVVEMSGCEGFDECIWADVLGGCEGGLIAAGAQRPVLLFVDGGTDGATTSTISARWD